MRLNSFSIFPQEGKKREGVEVKGGERGGSLRHRLGRLGCSPKYQEGKKERGYVLTQKFEGKKRKRKKRKGKKKREKRDALLLVSDVKGKGQEVQFQLPLRGEKVRKKKKKREGEVERPFPSQTIIVWGKGGVVFSRKGGKKKEKKKGKGRKKNKLEKKERLKTGQSQ